MAVLLRESRRAVRQLFDLGDGLTLGGSDDGVIVRTTSPAAVISQRDGAWWIQPGQVPVLVDDEILVRDQPLRHGQSITSADQLGWRLRFFTGDRERVLDELRHVEHAVDSLTGVLKRAVAYRQLDRIESGVVMMVDLDHLKRINDQLGMPAGDFAIRRTAAILRAHVAWPDIVARYGGEEFLVVMPGVDLVQARALAERIRRAAEPSFVYEGDAITATISIGLGLHDGETTIAMRHADDALMRAKTEGRNRVSG